MLLQEGFVAARTCERFDIAPDAPLEMSTGVNAYRHLVDGARLLQLANRDLRKTLRLFANWDDIAILLFDVVHAAGGVFHLWGHSWEIEANNDWKRLDRVLAHISGHPDVSYVNNTAVAVAISNLAVSAQQ
jgi:hypothetical protein